MVEDGSPIFVVTRNQLDREKGTLECRDGVMSNVPARVDALGSQGLEYGSPVRRPSYSEFNNYFNAFGGVDVSVLTLGLFQV